MTTLPADGIAQVTVLKPKPAVDARLVALTSRQGLPAEKFRILGTRLVKFRTQRSLKNLLITSCVPEEGKSFVAANLAVTLAGGQNQRVLLLGGDLRHPGLNSIFGFGKLTGLAEYLQGQADLCQALYRVERMPLWFLPPGNSTQQPADLLQSDRLAPLMALLAESFDWVLVDSPPMVPWVDASSWARFTDGILLVVREEKTPKSLLAQAIESLDGSSILGVVFNQDRRNMTGCDQYYQTYGGPQTDGQGDNGFRIH